MGLVGQMGVDYVTPSGRSVCCAHEFRRTFSYLVAATVRATSLPPVLKETKGLSRYKSNIMIEFVGSASFSRLAFCQELRHARRARMGLFPRDDEPDLHQAHRDAHLQS